MNIYGFSFDDTPTVISTFPTPPVSIPETLEVESIVRNVDEQTTFGNLIPITTIYSNTYEPTGNIFSNLTNMLAQRTSDTYFDANLYGYLKSNKWNTFSTNIEGLTLTQHLNRLSDDNGTGSYGSMNKNVTAYHLKNDYFNPDIKDNWKQIISTQIVPTYKSIWVFIIPLQLRQY